MNPFSVFRLSNAKAKIHLRLRAFSFRAETQKMRKSTTNKGETHRKIITESTNICFVYLEKSEQ